jgi:hypothetical protein
VQNLTRAHDELFRRTSDETFPTLQALWEHTHAEKERSADRWRPPQAMRPVAEGDRLLLDLGEGNEPFHLNDWSFTQLCGHAGVSKETVNRVSADTASRIFRETLPAGNKPLQVFTEDDLIRSVHGHSYTRLHNVDLLTMLREFATDFQPPQRAEVGGPDNSGGGNGLYCGEQDMFCFLIDPTGWAEIDGQAFAPGFYVWNSEVGKRSVGISTFWFQAVCRNHIIWDATEVVEFTRKHTGKVGEALGDIRRIVLALVEKRDARRDGFLAVMKKAMEAKLGEDAEETMKALTRNGIPKGLAKRALEVAAEQGRFTIFAVVDALTRIARELPNAGDRTDADQKASALLALVTT